MMYLVASSHASWRRSGPLGSGESFCRSTSSGNVPSGERETSEGGRGVWERCLACLRTERGGGGVAAGKGATLFVGTFLSGRHTAGNRSGISAPRDPSRAAGSGCGLEGERGRGRGIPGGRGARVPAMAVGSGGVVPPPAMPAPLEILWVGRRKMASPAMALAGVLLRRRRGPRGGFGTGFLDPASLRFRVVFFGWFAMLSFRRRGSGGGPAQLWLFSAYYMHATVEPLYCGHLGDLVHVRCPV